MSDTDLQGTSRESEIQNVHQNNNFIIIFLKIKGKLYTDILKLQLYISFFLCNVIVKL